MSLSSRILPLTLWAALAGAALWAASSRLTVQNPRGLWTVSPDPPARQFWTLTQQQFGDRDVLLVALVVPRNMGPTPEPAALVLQQWIERQPEVAQVLGVGQLQAFRSQVGPFGGRLLDGLRDALIGRDSVTALTYVVLVPPVISGSLDVKVSLIARLLQAAPDILPAGSHVHLAGQPAIDVALDQLLRDDFRATVPRALVAVGVALLLLMLWSSLAAVATVAVSLIVLSGCMALAGVPVSSATAVALPLTVVVGVSYTAHVALAIARAGGNLAALREIRAPLAWSYVTTVVALGSFALSPIRALRLFSATSCLGITVAFVAALTMTPFLGSGFSRSWARDTRRRLTRAGVRVFRLAVRHRSETVGIWAVVILVVLVGALRVRVEPNSYLSFFPGDHRIALAYNTIDDAMGGSLPLHVVAHVDSGVAFRQERVRTRLDAFLSEAERQMQIGPVLQPPPARLLRRESEPAAAMARWFQGRDWRYARAIFAVPMLSTPEAKTVIQNLEALASSHSDDSVSLRVTGLLPASLPMQQMLVNLMAKSLGILALFVMVALALASRSVRGGLILVVPNLVAVLTVVGVMGFCSIPVDFTTVSVVSLVLGVAVDDTLQLTWAGRGNGRLYRPSIAVKRIAAPVLLGSIAMIVGALTLAASPFPPTRYIGGLLALGLLAALAADLTLTPLLIARWAGRR